MDAIDNVSAARSTYRYLRLAIVVVIATLFTSLIIEWSRATCLQTSISSYYYTPVHPIFIAALGTIGVALVAIRGCSELDEALLNLAGFLAPIVALVPTGWSDKDCPSNPVLNGIRDRFQGNNLLAYLVGGAVAIGVAALASRLTRKRTRLLSRKPSVTLPLAGAVAVVIAGIIWYVGWRGSFSAHAHSYSAISMFTLVGVFIVRAAKGASGTYRRWYATCAAVMAAGVVVAILGFASRWSYTVLAVEVGETTPFVVFWFVQSIERWDADVVCDPPTESPSLTTATPTPSLAVFAGR